MEKVPGYLNEEIFRSLDHESEVLSRMLGGLIKSRSGIRPYRLFLGPIAQCPEPGFIQPDQRGLAAWRRRREARGNRRWARNGKGARVLE
jgi:hypothetical protein